MLLLPAGVAGAGGGATAALIVLLAMGLPAITLVALLISGRNRWIDIWAVPH